MSRDSIRQRLEAATEGPWAAQMEVGDDPGDPQWIVSSPKYPAAQAMVGSESTGALPDAAFIAHARQDIPALLAVADAAAAFYSGTYDDGRPFKGGDLTEALRALEALP